MSTATMSTVPARDGYDWLRLAFRLFRLQWLRYCSIAALFILILQFSAAITGGVLSAFLYPVLKVGFLAAAWHHERGELPEVSHLFAGFKSNLKALLPLGIVYLIGLLISMAIGVSVAGIDIEAAMVAGTKGALPSDQLMLFMVVVIACMLPVNATLWFAASLVVFADAGFIAALVQSFRAWTRNLLAVIVYGVCLFGLMFVVALLALPFVMLFGEQARLFVLMMAMVPVTAIVMISDYVSYRRVFHRSERLQMAAM